MTPREFEQRLDILAAGINERLAQNGKERAQLIAQETEIEKLRASIPKIAFDPERHERRFIDTSGLVSELVTVPRRNGHR